jgi:6-phosphogluconolactonase
MDAEPPAHRYADLETLSRELASQISAALTTAIEARGTASLVVSGGKSPVKLFEILRGQPLDWSRVCLALADERWVSPDNAASNERLVRDVLLQERAAAARFLGLKNGAPTPDLGAVSAWETFARVPRPFDAVILGMGDDGHTASLFPGSPNLHSALNQSAAAGCVGMWSPVAPQPRLSLNLTAARFAAGGADDQRRCEMAHLRCGIRARPSRGHAGARGTAAIAHAGRCDVVAVKRPS